MSFFSLKRHLTLLAFSSTLFCNCSKKTEVSNKVSQPPAITPVGTPVGIAVSKALSSSGGSISSADGRIDLNFPAGALNGPTNISIQPVTSEAPGGLGNGYHLMPEGLVFSKAVTLTFHYSDTDANGTIPQLFYIAYQDSSLAWRTDIKNIQLDTFAKTVSIAISHFSIWQMGDRIKLVIDPDKDEVHEKETRNLEIIQVTPGVQVDEDLYSLVTITKLPDNTVTNWKLNGSAGPGFLGTLSGSGNAAVYTAPPLIELEQNVQVSAELNYSLVYFVNGQSVSVNKLILFHNLELVPDAHSYSIKINYQSTGTAGMTLNGAIDKYTDGASMQVDVSGDAVAVSKIVNQVPSVTPTSGLGPDGITHVQSQLDSLGTVNITGASGSITTVDNIKLVSLTFTSAGTRTPKWVYSSAGVSYTVGGDLVPGYPGALSFILADSTQSLAQGNILVTPIH